jgi:hypothetical protein
VGGPGRAGLARARNFGLPKVDERRFGRVYGHGTGTFTFTFVWREQDVLAKCFTPSRYSGSEAQDV